jgi:hypothetical protein
MSNLSFFTHEFGDNEIRVVGDGRFSVYDVLVAFGAYPNLDTARITFKRLEKQNPEVSDFCSDFKFPGRGQRETPVTNEEGMYQILMLCPGKRGAEFRRWAAGIIADPDKALDHAVRKYRRLGWSDKQIKARLDGKVARYQLTDTLKNHGVAYPHEYARCTNAVNVGLFGQTAKQLQASRKVKSTRDGLDELELAALTLAEIKSGRTIEDTQAWGADQCEGICSDVARKVKRVLED